MPNSIKICTFLIFLGINLRFATEHVINALVFVINMQTGSPDAPCIAEICGDMIILIIFAAAYLFVTSDSNEESESNASGNLQEELGEKYHEVISQIKNYIKASGASLILRNVHLGSVRKIKCYVRRTKGTFFMCITGLIMYLLSKYVLSIGLEVFNIENDRTNFILNTFNDTIKTYSSLVFVYVYCRYLSTNRIINIFTYLFFFVRNIFGTNIMELMTNYDTYAVVPFLDIATSVLFVYAIYYSIISYRGTYLFKIIGTHKTASSQQK